MQKLVRQEWRGDVTVTRIQDGWKMSVRGAVWVCLATKGWRKAGPIRTVVQTVKGPKPRLWKNEFNIVRPI